MDYFQPKLQQHQKVMHTFEAEFSTFNRVQLCASNHYASIQPGGRTHHDPHGTVC